MSVCALRVYGPIVMVRPVVYKKIWYWFVCKVRENSDSGISGTKTVIGIAHNESHNIG